MLTRARNNLSFAITKQLLHQRIRLKTGVVAFQQKFLLVIKHPKYRKVESSCLHYFVKHAELASVRKPSEVVSQQFALPSAATELSGRTAS